MITVIIKRSGLFPIPNIVKHHKTVITMFEIRKEVVNSIGNVQRSEQIGFVNCTKEDVINHLSKTYYQLAKANTLYYKIRGQSYKVRYVFIHKPLIDIKSAAAIANANIKICVDEANEYIKFANTVYKESNHKRGLRDKSLTIKPVDVGDFMFSNAAGDDDDGGYVLMVTEK